MNAYDLFRKSNRIHSLLAQLPDAKTGAQRRALADSLSRLVGDVFAGWLEEPAPSPDTPAPKAPPVGLALQSVLAKGDKIADMLQHNKPGTVPASAIETQRQLVAIVLNLSEVLQLDNGFESVVAQLAGAAARWTDGLGKPEDEAGR